jgi:Tfp pilus assembly protein PilX
VSADRQRGFGAIVLIAVLLVAALLYFAYFRTQSGVSEKKTAVSAIDNSRAFACKTNRQTVEREIQMWRVNHPDEAPSLAALEADGAHVATCPEGGTYSLIDGAVVCSRHGE